MGGGLLVICAFFIVGGLFEHIVHIPGPVLMILFAVLCKYCRVIRPRWKPARTVSTSSSPRRWCGR